MKTYLPPGFSTRCISKRARSTSGTEHMISVPTRTSTELSSAGMSSACPQVQQTFKPKGKEERQRQNPEGLPWVPAHHARGDAQHSIL